MSHVVVRFSNAKVILSILIHIVFTFCTILGPFVDIPEQRLNRACRYWSSPQVLCHPADSHSSDECQRYDFPALYWDCLAPLSFPIHPQENPNVLIPRGNIYFFVFTICLAMIYWLLLPPSQRLLILFGKSDFHTFRVRVYVAQVSRGDVKGNWLWGAAVFESLRCHSSAANGTSGR